MARLENWPAALAAEVAAWSGVAFSWEGRHCGAFAAACERAITGATRFEDALSGYRTELGLARRLRALGCASLEDLVAARLPEIRPSYAQRGDVVVIDTKTGPALGVVTGAQVMALGPEGLGRHPLALARRAFKVD